MVVKVVSLLCVWASLCTGQLQKFLPSDVEDILDNRFQKQGGQTVFHNSAFVKAELGKLVPTDFTALDRCEVVESSRVGCGEPGITPAECEALNCCYDNRRFIAVYNGPMCYYGSSVTVQCTQDGQFVLVIARDTTVPRINLDGISMLETSDSCCRPVDSNADFIIYQFPITACGTRMKVEGDTAVFENIMGSSYEVEVSPQGAITRDSFYELTFECRYLMSEVKRLEVEINTLPPPAPVLQQGPMRLGLRLANGICVTKGCSIEDLYSSYYTEADYPVVKVLKDPVYVDVRMLDRADPNIAIVLNRCWATSTPDPSSLPQWDLLFNGCPYKDNHYQTTLVPVSPTSNLQYPTHHKRFIVRMFTFVDNTSLVPLQEQIYLHCSTAVCQLTSSETCEPKCHRTRRSLSATQDPRRLLVSSGMVLLISNSSSTSAMLLQDATEASQDFGYGLYAVAALAFMSICGLLVVVLIRKLKSSPPMQVVI